MVFKIDELEAVKVFLLAVSEIYKDYNEKIVQIAEDSDGDSMDDEDNISDKGGDPFASDQDKSISDHSDDIININERNDASDKIGAKGKMNNMFGTFIKKTAL